MAKWLSAFPDGVYTSGIRKYKLTYGAGNALEPFYYRILYSLDTLGIKQVKKVYDWYNISPKTQEFGFASQNLRQEMASASQLLGQIGTVAKSLAALRKDQQRINECLEYYNHEGKLDEVTLKGIWVDFVDVKSGAASFVNAAKNLDLYVARDWFFKIKDLKELETIPKGVITDVVRHFLARKFREYEVWKKHWKQSLLQFKKIIDQQYQATKKSIELYRQWVQPLLYNVESLKMRGKYMLDPELLKIGSNLLSEVMLVAWSPKNYVEPKNLLQAKEEYAKKKKEREERKARGEPVLDYIPFGKAYAYDDLGRQVEVPFVPVIEIKLKLVGPSNTQYMTTIAEIAGKIYTIEEFEDKLFDEWNRDPAEEWIKALLLREGIELEEEEKKEEKKKVELFPGQEFLELLISKLKFRPKKKPGISKRLTDHMIMYYVKKAAKDLNKRTWLVYFILKKSFGMYTYDKR